MNPAQAKKTGEMIRISERHRQQQYRSNDRAHALLSGAPQQRTATAAEQQKSTQSIVMMYERSKISKVFFQYALELGGAWVVLQYFLLIG